MKCPNCNYENAPDAKYCKRCDEPLMDETGLWVYKDKNGIISRPCSVTDMQDKYDAGIIKKNTKVREEGSDEWISFKDSDLYLPFAAAPKSRKWTAIWIAAGVIAFLFIVFGIFKAIQPEEAAQVRLEDFKSNYNESNASLIENGWTIVETPVYHFQQTPIPVYDKGYIVKVSNKYGIIDLEGNYIVEPEYNSISIDGAVAEHTVFYKNGDTEGTSLEYLLKMSEENKVPETTEYAQVSINPNRNVTLPEGTSRDDFSTPIAINLEDFWYEMFNGGQKYYIWNPKNDRVFGPFDTSETAMFVLDGTISDQYYPVPGLFYSHKDGQYTIYSNQGSSKTSQTFAYAKPISDSYMLVGNNNELGVIDSNLNVTFIGRVEDVSAPINGVDYVKIDGNWYRIYNLALQNAQQNQPEPEEENKEDEEKEDKSSQYQLLYNMYIRTSPGGSVVSVQHAGSILTIVDTQDVDGMTYGQLEDGNWICIFDGSKSYLSKVEE